MTHTHTHTTTTTTTAATTTAATTRARSRWGAIANPLAKVFDSPSTPQSHPGAYPWQQNEYSVQYVFYLLFVRTHTKFGIKILTC